MMAGAWSHFVGGVAPTYGGVGGVAPTYGLPQP